MNPDRDLSRLYREAAREQTPEWLDHAVLEAARKEGRRRIPSFSSRWQAPLALAAVLILTVSLTLTMDGALEKPQVGVQSQSWDAHDPRSPALRGDAQSVLPSTPTAEPLPPELRVEELAAQHLRDWKRSFRAKPEPLVDENRVGSAAAQTEASRSAPAAATTQKCEAERRAPAEEALRESERDARWSQPIEALRGQELPAEKPIMAIPERTIAVMTPEQWLRGIEQLRREGREAEARVSLQAFRERYPDHPVPQSLK